jgi:hypothetical protein
MHLRTTGIKRTCFRDQPVSNALRCAEGDDAGPVHQRGKQYLKVLKLAAEAGEDKTVIGNYSPGHQTCGRPASLHSWAQPMQARRL